MDCMVFFYPFMLNYIFKLHYCSYLRELWKGNAKSISKKLLRKGVNDHGKRNDYECKRIVKLKKFSKVYSYKETSLSLN